MEITAEGKKALNKAKKGIMKGEDKLTQAKHRIYSKTKKEGGKTVRKFYYNPSEKYNRMKQGLLHDERAKRTIEFKKEIAGVVSISRALVKGAETMEGGHNAKQDLVFTSIKNFQPVLGPRKTNNQQQPANEEVEQQEVLSLIGVETT